MQPKALFTFDVLCLESPHYSTRNNTKINSIIVHCFGTSLPDVFKIFTDLQVSAHYIVPQITGRELQELMPEEFAQQSLQFPHQVPVIRLVADDNRASHAGISHFSNFNSAPGCEKSLSTSSIGIEFHAPGYTNGDNSDMYQFTHYSKIQQETGIKLIAELMQKHLINKHNLLAHSTIAVARKTDPGPLFFWKELFEQGLGYLPTPKSNPILLSDRSKAIRYIQCKLNEIGFQNCPQNGQICEGTHSHIDAYMLQYAPNLWQGKHTAISQELLDSLYGFDVRITDDKNFTTSDGV